MLLDLPPELVTLVLEHADGKSLAKCCRVSKVMCSYAQPVLWHDIDIRWTDESDPLIKPELLAHTRTFSLEAPEDHLYFIMPIAPHLSSAARVTLELYNPQLPGSPVPRVDLRALQCISGLRSLRVFDRVLLGSAPLRLNNLVVLELADTTFEPASLLANLSPRHLPSLRALFLMNAPSNLVLNSALLSQLDCIQTDCQGVDAVPHGNNTPALLTVETNLELYKMAVFRFTPLQAAKVRHVRFMGGSRDAFDDTRYLRKVVKKLVNLQSVWMPDASHRTAHFRSFLDLCRRRRVSVHWTSFVEDWSVDDGFWEYAKGLKAKGKV
ncbi:hypothetical protein JCM10450v2_002720 [Rhodotorula kratochvilovae]